MGKDLTPRCAYCKCKLTRDDIVHGYEHCSEECFANDMQEPELETEELWPERDTLDFCSPDCDDDEEEED